MKKKLLLLFGFFSFFIFESITAQEYEYLEITSGLNEDVIANGANTAAASTTTIVDNDSFAFVAADFQPTGSSVPPAYGLPVSGTISSLATPGLSYQLADYSENNSLRIHGTTPAPALTTGTLVFSNQVNAKKLYVLATSGSGASTVSIVINFTDATSQTITGSVIPDWFNSNVLPIAASGFGRVGVGNNIVENPTGNPRMYQLTLNIDAQNQIKQIESIQFTKTSTAQGVANIFAVTAELLGSCPSPAGLTGTSGADSGTVNWTAPVIIPVSYDYYVSEVATAPTATTEPTGNVASDVTSVEFNDLIIGQTYYVWVRSNCGDGDAGPWVSTMFTTGQLSFTYTDGDISTLYNSSPTVNSTTACPGMMSVTVPDGYQIASIATSYIMTSQNNGYQSEQRTMLFCTTTGIGESSLASGSGNVGTYSYNRNNITIANGATGIVDFELRAWRTWQGSGDCNTTYNKVNNNTWTVTITYECVTPATPVAEAQTVCGGTMLSELAVSAAGDEPNLLWYASETGDDVIEDSTVAETGTYYVALRVNTCESLRQAVSVTVNTTAAPATEMEQTLCSGSTVADLTAAGIDGAEIAWYATADGEALGEDAEVETGSYFVSQSVEGCESERVEVAVTVHVTAEATTEATQTFCAGATVNDLFAEGNDIKWYADAEGEVLGTDAVLESGSYFVSQTTDGCESTLTEVAVTVNAIPDAPTGEATQDFETGDTVADLDVVVTDGADVAWFVMDGDNYVAVGTDVALTDEMTYYVMQTVNGCDSDYLAVTANEILGTTPFGLKGLSVYPNPASDVVNISYTAPVSQVTVTNMLGQTVLSQNPNTNEAQVNVSNLAQGTYILTVQSGSKTAALKIVKQ